MTPSRPAATPASSCASDGERILNRDVWTVTGLDADGSLQVRHATRPRVAALPASYVADDVVLAYATTIAGAQGRTVQRGHVVVTPRTTSASLYVGMTRGREANHAHVVCDSHDHVEFELGDLTAEQAFAAATRRDADGQLSANTVQQRWDDGRPDRTTARAADRQHRHVVDWWTTRQRSLPPAMRTALAQRPSPGHRTACAVPQRPGTTARRQQRRLRHQLAPARRGGPVPPPAAADLVDHRPPPRNAAAGRAERRARALTCPQRSATERGYFRTAWR